MSRTINIHEFQIEKLKPSQTWIIIGPIGSGKTTLVTNLIYFNRSKYASIKLIIGNADGYEKWRRHIPPLFITDSNKIDLKKEVSTYISRSNDIIRKSKKPKNEARTILVLDDVKHASFYKTDEAAKLFEVSNRHSESMTILTMHSCKEIPPRFRENAMYIAIFFTKNRHVKKKIYETVADCCDFDEFCSMLDTCTKDHACLIIDNTKQSGEISNIFYYYKPRLLGDWKFGCKEIWLWNDKRIKKN